VLVACLPHCQKPPPPQSRPKQKRFLLFSPDRSMEPLQGESPGDDVPSGSSVAQIFSDVVESASSLVRRFSGQSVADDHIYIPVSGHAPENLPASVSSTPDSPEFPTSCGGDCVDQELARAPPELPGESPGNDLPSGSSAEQIVSDAVESASSLARRIGQAAASISSDSRHDDDHTSSLPLNLKPPTSCGGDCRTVQVADPMSASPGTRSRRRVYLIALLAILIAGGTFFALKHREVIGMNESRPKIQEPASNSSHFFSPVANSSEFLAVNDTSMSTSHNSSRAASRSSCSFYSCSSCTYWEGCGWCVHSGRCSSGEELKTYDEMCFGGYAGKDWIWYTSDCASRCSAGSYSSTGQVR
jgi:hypothetical protein